MRLNWIANNMDEIMVWVNTKEEILAFSTLMDNDYNVCKMSDEDLYHINAVIDRLLGE